MEVYRNPASAFVARFLGSPPMNLLPATLEVVGGQARVRVADAVVDLPYWPLSALAPHLTRAVTFGIRPEDLYEDPPRPMPRLGVRVRAIESLGAETILLLSAGEDEVVARVGRNTSFRIGEMREIGCDVAAAHLFDPASGQAILK
jgi:ABC-type sugar transport system ATPase subunit